jgi:hypothetical protein
MIILGAGLSGLIAAAVNPQAQVYEANSREAQSHRAVLRFRTGAVGDAVGIPFRKIRVNKGIWSQGKFHAPDIRSSNLYSFKVTGGYYDRSIWNLDAADRYIAPEDFLLRLIEQTENRITWDTTVTELPKAPVISTIPMNKLLNLVNHPDLNAVMPEFRYSPINVQRFRVKDADVFQTIYYPSPQTAVYRASITGDLLIIESVSDDSYSPVDLDDVFFSFGITNATPIDKTHKQSYGKIAPIQEEFRRMVIEDLSNHFGIYSLGRFATWRNILLDDVLKDLNVIKRLLTADSYTKKMMSLKD